MTADDYFPVGSLCRETGSNSGLRGVEAVGQVGMDKGVSFWREHKGNGFSHGTPALIPLPEKPGG
jgi:hypothetical protein